MASLKFGLLFYPHHPIGTPPQHLVQAAIAHARLAESLGFDMVWTGHHYLMDDQTLQPIPLLARLAAEVSRVKLGAWFILAMGNPLDLAEQLATLDAITEGRLICGAVMGYRDAEFQNLGIPKSERVSRLEETLAILKQLWTQDDVNFEGRHFQIKNATVHLKPVQKPWPPFWVGGNSAPAVRRAAHIGDAWGASPYATLATLEEHTIIYNRTLAESGRDPDTMPRPLLREAFIAQDNKTAFQEAERYLAPFYQTYVKWGKEEAMGRPGELSRPFEELIKDRFFIGDPGYFIEEIQRYHERLGTDTFIFQINRPGMPTEVVLDGVRLLGETVLPHFQ